MDAAIAIPAIVLLLLLMSIYRPSTAMLVLVIAGTSWLSTARLVRAEALTLRVREYVQAARVMGGGGLRVILRHIAPNAIGTIVVNVSFQIANAILILATLSWLGLGVQFPSVDWGDMIGAATQTISDGYWWQIVCPGVAIIVVIVGVHHARRRPAGRVLRGWLRRPPAAPADPAGPAADLRCAVSRAQRSGARDHRTCTPRSGARARPSTPSTASA